VPAKNRSRFASAASSRAISSPAPFLLRAAASPRFERVVKPSAKLGGRLAGERHGGHVLDLIHALGHTGGHPFGQHLRLAGTGASFDEDVREQFGANRLARLLVERP
jgi:hypothetical protein